MYARVRAHTLSVLPSKAFNPQVVYPKVKFNF